MSRGNRRRRSLWLTRLHRYAGITAALFTILLAVTGLLLQHAPALGLDRARVGSAAVARWLGLEVSPVRAWRVDDRWLIAAGDGLWLDEERLGDSAGRVQAAVATGFGVAVAVGGDVRLFRDDGRPIDRLRAGAGLPARVGRLGRTADGRIVLGADDRRWVAREDWLAFQPYDGDGVRWQRPAEPPRRLTAAVRRGELARSVDWERLLLAVHSGRLGGGIGSVVMDLAAVALLVLAGSGLYLWWHRR